MENKYYTPDISEFHVGFEFEIKNSSDDPFEWEKSIINKDFSHTLDEDAEFYSYIGYLEDGFVRVKYLDKEDIESLGFKYIPTGTKDQEGHIWNEDNEVYELGVFSTSDNYTLLFNLPNKEYWEIRSNCHWIGDPSNMSTLFCGHIKNKSALKVLLKQLGI